MQSARLIRIAVLGMLLTSPVTIRAEPASPIAVFPFELLDTSGEGAKAGQPERLVMATRELTDLLAQAGRYRPVDLTPLAAELVATEPRYACGDCWLAVAREAGADFAAIAVVHKVSTLISTMDIRIAEVRRARYIADAHGQIRGDNDVAYRRGVDFLVKERLLAANQ